MKIKFCYCFIIWTILISCSNKKEAVYFVNKQNISNGIELKQWNILGPIKSIDTTATSFLDKDHILISGVKESDFIKNPYNYNLHINSKYFLENGLKQEYYCSKDSILDYEEISAVKKDKLKDVKGSAIYLYCKISSDTDHKVYFMARSTDGIKVWLNNVLVNSSNECRDFALNFADLITINLRKGINQLVIKKINLSNNIFFEALLGDEKIKLKNYYQNSNLILYYPIANDKLWLSANHAKDLDTSINYSVKDINAKEVLNKQLLSDSATYLPVASLPRNHSYLCNFTAKGYNFSQPFFVGSPDTAFIIFSKRRDNYQDKEVLQQIDAYLFRFKYLLSHESRNNDWWWQFKVSDILFELENYLNNIDKKQNEFLHSYGIILRAYSSNLDSSTQHYLLIRPDSIKRNENLPLVVVIRPVLENHRHFLTSPQMARFWSLTYAKYLANKYKYIVIMPDARLYLNEQFIPMAEQEILNAISDVQKYLPIDKNRIYLHGNCSAGYRCLTLACHYPDRFAAIGLYAPVYHFGMNNDWVKKHSPENLLMNLFNTPIMLHYDPRDTHSPYSFFEDFIKDGNKKNLKIQVSSSKLSGLLYNVLLVGEEAFSFFEKMRRTETPRQIRHVSSNEQYNKINWISYKSKRNNEKTRIDVDFIQSANKISCSGENISELVFLINRLKTNNKVPLIVEYNNKIIYKKITNSNKLKLTICKQVQENINDFTAYGKIIADLFAEPFIYTYENHPEYCQNIIDSVKNEYEHYLFAKCPIKSIDKLSRKDISENNLFIIGHKFDNKLINMAISKLPLSVKTDEIRIFNKSYSGHHIVFQAIFKSPFNSKKLIVVYSTNDLNNFTHEINYPWKNGLESCMIKQ